MINPKSVKREIAAGLSAVCAWCEHYHNARDMNMTFFCGKDCNGPAHRGSFPQYKGLMKAFLPSFCFICGEGADSRVDMPDGGSLGVCSRLGPNGQTCTDKLRLLLDRQGVVAREIVVPVIGKTVTHQ